MNSAILLADRPLDSGAEPSLDQVLAAYWLARAPRAHAPLGGWAPYLRPEQVGAPELDSYWAADARRPTLSPTQAAAWSARLQRAAEQDPLFQGDWRPTPTPLVPQENDTEEPSPRDLALVAAAVPALLAAGLTDLESATGGGGARPTTATPRRPLPLTLPLPQSVIALPQRTHSMPKATPSTLPTLPTPAAPTTPRAWHRFTSDEDSRILAAGTGARDQHLKKDLAVVAADLHLKPANVLYRYYYLRGKGSAPATATDPAALPVPPNQEPPLTTHLPGDAELAPRLDVGAITLPPLLPDSPPLTAQGRLVITDGARTVATLTVEIADLAALVGRGLLRLG